MVVKGDRNSAVSERNREEYSGGGAVRWCAGALVRFTVAESRLRANQEALMKRRRFGVQVD